LLKSGLTCSIPFTRSWFPAIANECSNDSEAETAFNQVFQSLKRFHADPGHLGCPAPCTSTSFKLGVGYVHENTLYLIHYEAARVQSYFVLYFRFDNLNTEQIIENLEYDLGSILQNSISA
jgi:hypothetical protein